jgi:Ca-activated chloride channel family protein
MMLLLASGSAGIARPQDPAVVVETPDKEGDSTGAGVSFTLNVNVDLVELQVLATDRAGRHVTTLDAADFVVTEDEIPQRITLFRQDDLPVSLGLVIDNSRSMERKKDRVDAAALSFVGYNNAEDEAFLIHFDDAARLAEGFTRNPEPIRKTLGAIRPYGQTALFDAVSMALETIGLGEHAQKAILLISDGADNASTRDFGSVLEEVRQSGATLYAIGVFGNPSAGREAQPVLEALAEAGGGRAFFPETAEEVPALTLRIAREIRDQYTLGYVPTNPLHDGTWRSVRVDVRPEAGVPNIRLGYRHGYYAPED